MTEWQPIKTAPAMKIILLFAVTDIGPNGEVRNWKMATGCQHTGSKDDEWWEWEGRILKAWEIHPTHWMPMPDPPVTPHDR